MSGILRPESYPCKLEYDVIKQNIDSILRLEKEPERGRETERLQ